MFPEEVSDQGASNGVEANDDACVRVEDHQPAGCASPRGKWWSAQLGSQLASLAFQMIMWMLNPHQGFLEELWDMDVDGVSGEVLSRLPGRDGASCRCHFDKRAHKMSPGVDTDMLYLDMVLVKATSPG
jgi:hypothetical protein